MLMVKSLVRSVFVALVVVAGPPTLNAQQRPPAPQASATQIRELQSLVQNSGLSLEQIRSRLKAEGFSENLLDPYFAGRSSAVPDSNVFAAVRKLGLSVAADSLRRAKADTQTELFRNKAPEDIEREFLDSVAVIAKDDTTRAAVMDLLRSRDPRHARIDSGYAVFGLDVFRRENNLFDPNDGGPVPPDYRVGPGDELVLILTGDTERSHELPVTREGMIFIPSVGAVPVANLTMRQLEDVLYSRLGRVYAGIRRERATAHFQISVAKLGSSQVSVLGDVTNPGAYRISKLGTVLTALYAAGGPTESGSLRQIELRRAGKPIATVDLYDYLISGNSTNDIRLESGDVILVSPHGARVRLAGPVIRPGIYELRIGETLGDLIRIAGGFRPEADRRRVQVQRFVPPELRGAAGSDRVLFDVAGASLDSSRELLLGGDVVHVLPVAKRVANQVAVAGNVWAPGLIAFTPGMKVSDAIARAGGVQPDTYVDALQVTRLQPDATRRIIRLRVPGSRRNGTAADVVDGASANSVADDIVVQPDDEIRVFSLSEYRPERYVTISGAVGTGGRYSFREGMTVRDLLMLAGGMKVGALLTEAEVARMPTDRREGTTAVTIRVPLDSSYLFDRRRGAPYLGPPGVSVPTRESPEFELKAYDNVLILRQPDWFLPRVVNISGEVTYPGDYTLRSKSERLVDLIERAGGLTRDAYPEGIVFYRSQNLVGRIGIDLPAAMRRHDHPDNLLLVNGDSIAIPFHSAVVTVTGSVNSPVAVAFESGQDLDYYIYAAGGPTAKADLKKAYVIQPSGKVESRRRRGPITSTPTPQPGGTVTVPERIPGDRFDVGATLAATTSILTSIVALVAILHR
jgi:polysaccharide biosynthesis/export protein